MQLCCAKQFQQYLLENVSISRNEVCNGQVVHDLCQPKQAFFSLDCQEFLIKKGTIFANYYLVLMENN